MSENSAMPRKIQIIGEEKSNSSAIDSGVNTEPLRTNAEKGGWEAAAPLGVEGEIQRRVSKDSSRNDAIERHQACL
jgi:hypothetical protein